MHKVVCMKRAILNILEICRIKGNTVLPSLIDVSRVVTNLHKFGA